MRRFALLILAALAGPMQPLIASDDAALVQAKTEFPDLANPDSIFSKAYATEEAQLRKTQPDFFTNENWPLMLAYRVATKLGISSASKSSDSSASQTNPAPTPASASATEDEATAAQKVSPFILTIKGDQGSGSGFILKRGSKFYLVTNAHVVEGNKNIKVASINKEFPMPSQILVAKARDIVMAELSGFADGLEAETDFSKVAIGDATLCLGNSSGMGVSRLVKGKLLGIGNDLIETDAAYVHGNSGSPILHLESGKVLGVVTYVEQSPNDRLVAESDLKELRHFAYRVDNVSYSDLVSVSLKDFLSGGELAGKIEERNEKIRKAIESARQSDAFARGILKFADIVYGILGFGGNMPFVTGGKFVGMEDIPDRSAIGKLSPYHKQQLHLALKDRLELVDALNITNNIIYRSCYVRVDDAGTLKQVDFRENVNQAVAATEPD